ncbi:MAG: ABC transporter permease [Dorea sp.]|jgi:hypothetical protein|uniref:ABC transporter permease n=1 Tax=Sporofaciens sp. JLR.KK001 TaxID=3112621 RepID=UPI00217359EB|nr:ABC transporter permease [Dorea sp.]
MMRYEVKKVFSRTSSKIAVLVLFLVMGVTCCFALDISYVDEEGNTQRGLDAVSKLKSAQKEWAGELDEKKISQVIAENWRIRNSPEALAQDITQNEIAYSRGQGIKEIRELLNCAYAKGFREYDYYRADSLTEEMAADFYKNRTALLKEWLEGEAKDQFSDKEKQYLIERYESLKTPFYYDYMAGWVQLFEFAPTIVMISMLILCYLVSGVFSNEFAWKSDAVFFSSEYGRNRAVLAKIKAGLCIVTAVYFAIFFVYTGIMLLYLGADGWNLQVQSSMAGWKYFYHITNLKKYLVIGAGGYIGCLFLSFLSMFVSARTKSTVMAMIAPVMVLFLPSFVGNIKSPVVNKILGLLPDQLLQAGNALNFFNLYSIGGKIVGEIPVIIVLYAVLTAALLPALYRTYQKAV